jgi:predicted enzyme related to lactoylglutathione lyase
LPFQEALFAQGTPCTAFEVDDLEAEVKRLKEAGVKFTVDSTGASSVRIAVFADNCGNLIQIYQVVDG